MEYELYGKRLKVEIESDEIYVLEGLQYVMAIDIERNGKNIFVLQSIKPKANLLIANELHTGSTSLLPINEYKYCDEPKYS